MLSHDLLSQGCSHRRVGCRAGNARYPYLHARADDDSNKILAEERLALPAKQPVRKGMPTAANAGEL
jgi:hypothetical protein